MAAAHPTILLLILKCFSLNKNCLFKLESSIMSGSVIVIFPLISYFYKFSSPQPIFNMAKFLSNSHPSAPTPTIKIFMCLIYYNNFYPKQTDNY